MATSQFVCFKCGLPVHLWHGDVWKHSSGRHNGRTPKSRIHVPVVCPREEYERAFALDTPRAEAIAIAEKYRGN